MLKPLLRVTLLLLLLTAVLGCATTTKPIAPPENGDARIMIQLRHQGSGPREIAVVPRATGVCVPAAFGCGETTVFRWIGNSKPGEELTITFDETTPSAEGCFGKKSDAIEGSGPATEVAFTAGAGGGECVPSTGKPAKVYFYTVACRGGQNGDCGGVKPLDPGLVVEGGGG